MTSLVQHNNTSTNLNAPKVLREESFPEKVFRILKLQEDSPSSAVWWTHDGKAVAVCPRGFDKEESIKFFQGIKFLSFTRRLLRNGFKRIAKKHNSAHVYAHPMFHKSHPERLGAFKVDRSRKSKALVAAAAAGGGVSHDTTAMATPPTGLGSIFTARPASPSIQCHQDYSSSSGHNNMMRLVSPTSVCTALEAGFLSTTTTTSQLAAAVLNRKSIMVPTLEDIQRQQQLHRMAINSELALQEKLLLARQRLREQQRLQQHRPAQLDASSRLLALQALQKSLLQQQTPRGLC